MAESNARIDIRSNGPLVITGIGEIRNSKGEALAHTDPAFLCRCGQSKNKPFCDGSHKSGFADERN
jgi:CDGSH-type Zn-finger protein